MVSLVISRIISSPTKLLTSVLLVTSELNYWNEKTWLWTCVLSEQPQKKPLKNKRYSEPRESIPSTNIARWKAHSHFKQRNHINSRSNNRNHASVNPNKQRMGEHSSQTRCSRCREKGHTASTCICSRNIECWKCQNVGHFANICQSKLPQKKRHDVRFVSDSVSERVDVDK